MMLLQLAFGLYGALGAQLTFTHMDTTWTMEAMDGMLHVTADCPETSWCGFGFNEDKPAMDGADVFTFGHHGAVDLADCPMAGCGCGCGCGATTTAGCGCGCGCGATTTAGCGCGCGCGATTTASCGCGCGCGATTTAGCGCGCGCGATTTAAGCGCGCGCGATTTAAGCGCGCGCGATTTAGCGCGARRLGQKKQAKQVNPYIPRVRDLKLSLPSFTTPGPAQSLGHVGGVVGIAMNSVLFVHEHPDEGMTWLFDNCGGHGDTFGHYHYHAPPLCLLSSLGVPTPAKGSWWKTSGAEAWPLEGPELQIGWALDGAPIMGPFRAGKRTSKESLDECFGATDLITGEYRYYLVPTAPYMPPCLRGKLGNITGYRAKKTEGQPCVEAKKGQMQTAAVDGGKELSGTGCPEHAIFKEVQTGHPFGSKVKVARQLKSCGCGAFYGTCPSGSGCGCGGGCGCGCGATTTAGCGCGCGCGATTTAGCGCGCGCGATTTAGCGCGCGCGATTTAGCGCGCGATTTAGCGCGCGCGATTTAGCGCGCGCGATTTAAGCGCGCGCGATTTAGCGCGCGCGATTTAGCGCGCGCGATTTAGCGCGAYACQGQQFCAMGMTKKTSAGTAVSMSQCNLDGHTITIDTLQDLSSYTLTFENGRMKVDAKRMLTTGDATDYELSLDKTYYILLVVGSSINVGYHGSSATTSLVCTSSLTQKGDCKAAAEWDNGPPPLVVMSKSFAMSLCWPVLVAMAFFQ